MYAAREAVGWIDDPVAKRLELQRRLVDLDARCGPAEVDREEQSIRTEPDLEVLDSLRRKRQIPGHTIRKLNTRREA